MVQEVIKQIQDWCKLKIVLWNKKSNSFLGLPLTKQEKQGSWYVEITMHGQKNWVMLNQARVFDKKRLTNRIGALDNGDLKKIKERFLEFYNS